MGKERGTCLLIRAVIGLVQSCKINTERTLTPGQYSRISSIHCSMNELLVREVSGGPTLDSTFSNDVGLSTWCLFNTDSKRLRAATH